MHFLPESTGKSLNTTEEAQSFFALLSKNLYKSIKLSGNTLSVEAAKVVGEYLKTQTELEVLDCSDIFTGRLVDEIPQAVTLLCEGIKDCPIKEMNWGDNAFGPRIQGLVEFLKNNKTVKVLKMSNNGLGQGGGCMVADALVHPITTFIAGRNRLEASIVKLAAAFQKMDSLEHVAVFQNGINEENVVELLKAIKHCENIKVLDLQDNTVGLSGAAMLSQCLKHWKNVRVINLADTLLTNKGCEIVIDALSLHSELEELNLTYNDMTEKNAMKLADAVRSWPKLKKLELNGNCFDPEGVACEAIRNSLDVLEHCDALDSLSDNDWEDVDEDADDTDFDLAEEDNEASDLADEIASKLSI